MFRTAVRIGKSAVKMAKTVNRRMFIDFQHDHRSSILLSGVGRSGTTWFADIINYRNEYRGVFEPFHPDKVKEAAVFGFHPYLRPDNRDPARLAAARTILSGRIRTSWTDAYNKKRLASKRIIKDIRTNLMLKWIHANFPDMPIVLLLRHPCAVANSRTRMGWKVGDELAAFLSEESLVADHLKPFRELIEGADGEFQRQLVFWCILTYVPLRQFARGEIHLAFYEEFCVDPQTEIARLFSFLNFNSEQPDADALRKPSSTSVNNSAIITGESLVESWRKHMSVPQMQAAEQILKAFGLDEIYTESCRANLGATYALLKH